LQVYAAVAGIVLLVGVVVAGVVGVVVAGVVGAVGVVGVVGAGVTVAALVVAQTAVLVGEELTGLTIAWMVKQ
jgi:hypothetical protein